MNRDKTHSVMKPKAKLNGQ